MTNILDFFNGRHDEERPPEVSELGSSGMPSTGNLMPFSYAPWAPHPIYGRHSATGEVWALKEAGRALLEELDEIDGWADIQPNPDVVQRFRALVEPK